MEDIRIIQIMPAPTHLFAIVYDNNGNKVRVPVLCLALNNSGVIQFMYLDSDGSIKPALENVSYNNI